MRCLQCHHQLLRAPSVLGRRPNRSISAYTTRGARSLVTLAIETSCDDTGVAVLSRSRSGKTALLFNDRISSDNRAFRGIQPAVTVIGHSENLAPLVKRALEAIPETDEDGRRNPKGRVPDFVSVTRGPGIFQSLATGLNTAKGLAVAWGVPLVGVHHMQAHALTPRLAKACNMPMGGSPATAQPRDGNGDKPSGVEPAFPFLSLLVSGGHTQLVHSAGLTDHRIVVNTADTAIGNVLDQTARVVLPQDVLDASPDVMYGRMLEAFAFPRGSDDYAFFEPAVSRRDEMIDQPSQYGWAVPLPFRQSRKLAYSFSSIHTNVHRIAETRPDMDIAERRELARHTLAAAFRHLVGRMCLALEDEAEDVAGPRLRDAKTLVVAGGVASNRFLMHVLRTTLDARGYGHMDIVAPPPALCTDNAAMIAWAGMEMYEAGYHTDLSALPIAKWPMDPSQGGGILGLNGWLKRD